METIIIGYVGIIGYILGLYRENGKENGNYYIIIGLYREIFGLYWENGKENGNYYIIIGLYREYWGYIGRMENKMETIGIIGIL